MSEDLIQAPASTGKPSGDHPGTTGETTAARIAREMRDGTARFVSATVRTDYEAPRDPKVKLLIRGVGRVASEPRAVLLALNERPTDEEIRQMHEALRAFLRATAPEKLLEENLLSGDRPVSEFEAKARHLLTDIDGCGHSDGLARIATALAEAYGEGLVQATAGRGASTVRSPDAERRSIGDKDLYEAHMRKQEIAAARKHARDERDRCPEKHGDNCVYPHCNCERAP